MPGCCKFRAGALVCLLLALACGRESRLAIDQVMGRSQEELHARWGTPDISLRQSERLITLQWKDVDGVWVYVACRDGRVDYATFTFGKLEPFEAGAAFRALNIEPPRQAPEHQWENGARRWMPFGPYAKLTVNPQTRAITVAATGSEEPPAQ